MKNKRSNIKTTISEIIKYWIKYEDECELNFDWSEADKICWRCGNERKLQRCHIIPDSLGGKDEPNNFVLLCAACHEEAPNVESSTFMWDWIKSFHNPFYNTFWQNQALEEYERIYHKSFLKELEERNIISNHALFKFWNLKTGKTSYHFGKPYGNISTLTGNYKLHLEAFDQKYPSKKYCSNKKLLKDLEFEKFTNSFCALAEKYHFSVWEGRTKNPYSLCMSAIFPTTRKILGISIKKKNYNYFMYQCNESNPNNIPISSYTINIGNNHKKILNTIENIIEKIIKSNGKPDSNHSYYFVADPLWRHKNNTI